MYNEFFGFREKPFNITPDPRFLFSSPGHQEAYANLLYGIRERKGFIVLTGEVGTGKTTLLRRVMDNLEESIRFVFFYNTTLSFEELLDYIFSELHLDPATAHSRLQKIQALNQFLISQLGQGGTVALLIDEAQNLTDEVLENLRLLSNLETAQEKLLQIVLVGQPELEQKLAQPHLRQLRQRIVTWCKLNRLKDAEVDALILYRLSAVGYAGPALFTQEALRFISLYSQGIPRLINVICDNALLLAYAASQKEVSAELIEETAHDLRLLPVLRRLSPPTALPMAASHPEPAVSAPVTAPPAEPASIVAPPRVQAPVSVTSPPVTPVREGRYSNLLILGLFAVALVIFGVFSSQSLRSDSAQEIPAQAPPAPRNLVTDSPTRALAPQGTLAPPIAVPPIPASDPAPPQESTETKPPPAEETGSILAAPKTEESPAPTKVEQKGSARPAPEAPVSPPAPFSPPPVHRENKKEAAVIQEPAPLSGKARTAKPVEVAHLNSPPLAPVLEKKTTAKEAEKSPPPAQVQAVEPFQIPATAPRTRVDVQSGGTILDLVRTTYGDFNTLALVLIKDFNPKIADLDHVETGAKVEVPSLTSEALLRKQPDGTYHLISAAFSSSVSARKFAQRVQQHGYQVEVVPHNVAKSLLLHRVEIVGLPDREAGQKAWELVEPQPMLPSPLPQEEGNPTDQEVPQKNADNPPETGL
ncbi:MAG: AAA family ATPase [Deltaproteobacteria bacterium]|nr:AAA family ATPase [Deltaproteobacteria bacterium]